MEAHIPGSTNDAERRFVKLESRNAGSGDSRFGEANGSVFLLHHLLRQNFTGCSLVSRCTFSCLYIFPLAQIREFNVSEIQTGKIGDKFIGIHGIFVYGRQCNNYLLNSSYHYDKITGNYLFTQQIAFYKQKHQCRPQRQVVNKSKA